MHVPFALIKSYKFLNTCNTRIIDIKRYAINALTVDGRLRVGNGL